MRRSLATLVLIPALLVTLAAPASATAPGWTHFRYVPTPYGEGWQCGVHFDSAIPTGYADFWYAPSDGAVERSIQHWAGTLTFKVAGGSSVTMREDDWRYVTDTYHADATGLITGYTEIARYVGLVEELSTTRTHTRLADTGIVTVRAENVFPDPSNHFWTMITAAKVTGAAGLFPMRRSGYDVDSQGWSKECAFFRANLR